MATLIPLQDIPEDCVSYAIFKQPQQEHISKVLGGLIQEWLDNENSSVFSLEAIFKTHPRFRILDKVEFIDTILTNIEHSTPEICAITALTFNLVVITRK